jgi:hypothetical protein
MKCSLAHRHSWWAIATNKKCSRKFWSDAIKDRGWCCYWASVVSQICVVWISLGNWKFTESVEAMKCQVVFRPPGVWRRPGSSLNNYLHVLLSMRTFYVFSSCYTFEPAEGCGLVILLLKMHVACHHKAGYFGVCSINWKNKSQTGLVRLLKQ